MGTHASGVLLSSLAYGLCRARRVHIQSLRQIPFSYKTALFAAAKLDRAMHGLRQLLHDIEADAAATAARMSYEQFAKLAQIASETLSVVDHRDTHAAVAAPYVNSN